jgi:four helix bundle protein
MAVQVNCLCQHKKNAVLQYPVLRQLIRSSSSVAANWRAATRGRSDAEFYSKICIVVEECDETQFWFDYLIRSAVLSESETLQITDEILQLLAIFTSIKRKMKIKQMSK